MEGDVAQGCLSEIRESRENPINTTDSADASLTPSWMRTFLEIQEREAQRQRIMFKETLDGFLQGTSQLVNTLVHNTGNERSGAEFLDNSSIFPNAIRENQLLFVANPPPKPEYKEGQTPPVRFLQEIEDYCRKLKLGDSKMLECALDGLTGNMKNWADLYRANWLRYEDFKTQFLKDFWSEREQLVIRREIYAGKWKEHNGESMRAYFARLVLQARTLTPTPTDTELATCLMQHFPIAIQSLWQLLPSRGIMEAAEFLQGQDSLQMASLSRSPRPIPENNPRKSLGPYKIDNRPVVVRKDNVTKDKNPSGNDVIGTLRTQSQ